MPTKAQAWVVKEAGAPFVLESVTIDDPSEDEVLVKMIATGVCHTDLSVAKGHLPASFPAILGHEGSAKVLEVGSKVKSLKPGDSVLLSWSYCQNCSSCKNDDPVSCSTWYPINFGKTRSSGTAEVGSLEDGSRVEGSFFGQSSFASHSLVKETSVCREPVPSDLDLELLCSLGCGIQTGAGGILNVAKPKPDDIVLISGLGSVGFSALFACASLGIKTVICVDVIQSRLEQAKGFGATHTINAKEADVPAEVMKITKDTGVRYAIECTGAPQACRNSFLSLGVRGKMVQIGASVNNWSLHPMEFLSHLREIIGCVEGDSNPPKFIPQLVDMYKAGQLPLDKITTKYSFKELEKAEHDMHSGDCVKAVLVYD